MYVLVLNGESFGSEQNVLIRMNMIIADFCGPLTAGPRKREKHSTFILPVNVLFSLFKLLEL